MMVFQDSDGGIKPFRCLRRGNLYTGNGVGRKNRIRMEHHIGILLFFEPPGKIPALPGYVHKLMIFLCCRGHG
jgi:hypothetical protein